MITLKDMSYGDNEKISVYDNDNVKIYFRIPLTIYFVGRTKEWEGNWSWSLLKIITKRFKAGKYYWNVVK